MEIEKKHIKEKYFYDKKSAEKVITFIEKYTTHTKGELFEKPILLEEWQKNDFIKPVFGVKHKLSGLRRYRTVYIEIPRKNAKSTLAAALALYLLMADGEPGAEVYSAAADTTQASIIFGIAKQMVINKKQLSNRAKTFRSSITYEKTGSFYKVLSKVAKTKHGFNAHGILFDELHTQTDRELYDVLTTSVGSRRQPLTILLTTAGTDRTSICWEVHEYARKVNEGIIQDETFLGIIYTAPKELDIFDPKTWKLANPGLGSIKKLAYIEEQANKVRNNPNHENTFRQLDLNQWTSRLDAWIADDVWMKCDKSPIDLKKYYGYNVVLGMDLASTDDTTSLAMVILDENDNPIAIVPWVWVPEEMVETRFSRGDAQYKNWVQQNVLLVTPGNVTDYRAIAKKVVWINENFTIKKFGFDKWNSSQLIIELADIVDADIFDKVEMNISTLSEPTKRFYKLIKKEEINHGGHPVLRWMASNVVTYRDTNENIRPSKQSSSDKIDGIMAVIVALTSLWSGEPEEDINQIFKNRGFTSG